MDIQVLRLTSTCKRDALGTFGNAALIQCLRSLFTLFTLSHPHYKRPPRGAKGERKKESRGLEQGKWIEGGYCGKGDYCSALSCLNPTILLSFNTFQWQPPLPILLRTHNLLSTSFLRQREICYSAWVEQVGGQGVGWGDKYGGFGGRPAIFRPQLHLFSTAWLGGPRNPLCWDWWPAVVRETNTLLKQAYMNITGRLVTLFMNVSQMTAFLESKCILVQSFHCVNDKIHYKSTLK